MIYGSSSMETEQNFCHYSYLIMLTQIWSFPAHHISNLPFGFVNETRLARVSHVVFEPTIRTVIGFRSQEANERLTQLFNIFLMLVSNAVAYDGTEPIENSWDPAAPQIHL